MTRSPTKSGMTDRKTGMTERKSQDDRKTKGSQKGGIMIFLCFIALGICAYFHCEIGAIIIPAWFLSWLVYKNYKGQNK